MSFKSYAANAVVFIAAIVLAAVGAYVLYADLKPDGVVTNYSAWIGAGALLLAVTLALPTQMKAAITTLTGVLRTALGRDKNGDNDAQ